MKNYVLGFATFSLIMMTGCTNNEIIDRIDSEHGSIRFSAISGKINSKAAETDISHLKQNGVTVFALTTADNGINYSEYFTDVLTYTEGTPGVWNTSVKRYLKEDMKNEFYSVYPKGAVSAATLADNQLSFSYSVSKDADEDLLGASAKGSYSPSNDKSTGVPVTLPFHHLLSQINFGIRLNNKTYGNVVVSEIVYQNVGASGQYTFGTEGIGVNNWSNTSLNNFALPLTAEINTETPDSDININVPFSFVLDRAKYSLMLVPARFSNSSISFKFQAYDLSGKEITNGITTESVALENKPLETQPFWKQGTRYTYLIDFDKWFIDRELKFDVTISDWVDYNQE